MSSYDYGALVGFLVALMIALVIRKFFRRNGKTRYDERQELVRGRGFKYAYFVLMVYEIAYVTVTKNGKPVLDQYMSPLLAVFVGVIISVTVYAVYCIWNDGYYGINEKAKNTLFALLAIAVLNVIAAIANSEEIIVDGKVGRMMMNLLCGFVILLVVIVTGIKVLVDKKRAGEEDDDE